MHIVHIASELAPLAKVGGLGDVLLGLSRELSWKGHDVDIIIPKYDCMDSNQVRDLAVEHVGLLSFYEGEWHQNFIWMGWVENLKVYFIDAQNPRFFFERGCIYGCDDDLERFLYFSRAALEFMYKTGLQPDIIHTHDWMTAVVAPLYYDMYQKIGFVKPRIIQTIHNADYQGKCKPGDLDKIGLEGKYYLNPERMQDDNSKETINLLKGGVVYADFTTTVSPTYAKEIMTSEFGKGLEQTFRKYKNKIAGILNGLDYSYWNPEIDRYLESHYSPRVLPANKKDHNTLDKKAFIKTVLREKMGLDKEHRPIVGCIARLVPQKSPELIRHALFRTLEMGGQFVLLGTSPIPSIHNEFIELRKHFEDHPQASLILYQDEQLAHYIYAGSDMFIVPSVFEPCGLTQLISLKYGTVPIVRKTGGLADTISDVDLSDCEGVTKCNGYTFDGLDAKSLDFALDRAIKCWYEEPAKWRKLMITGMSMDFSWNKPANEYVDIYKKVRG